MRGKAVLILVLVIGAAGCGALLFQAKQKKDAQRPLIAGAITECRENLAFLNSLEPSVKETGSEDAAMAAAQKDIKFQLKAKSINDLLRLGADGEMKKALTRISDRTDSYNMKLAAVFYMSGGYGNVSVSEPQNPPTTADMISEFEALLKLLEK